MTTDDPMSELLIETKAELLFLQANGPVVGRRWEKEAPWFKTRFYKEAEAWLAKQTQASGTTVTLQAPSLSPSYFQDLVGISADVRAAIVGSNAAVACQYCGLLFAEGEERRYHEAECGGDGK